MKKFNFSLKPLYTMKENEEKQQKMQLKAIESQMTELNQELEALGGEYEKIKSEFCEAVIQGIEAAHAMQFGEYFLKLKTIMMQKEESIKKLGQEKEKCLNTLVSIRKEKKMLEKLKQNEYAAYKQATKKEHSKVMEDFFSYKVSVL